jgi:ribonucleoside-diphosphate reductase beta chain
MSAFAVRNYSEPTILRPDSFPMRLFEKAKRLGVWNPSDFDFSQDRGHWETMDEERRLALLQLTAAFLGGEEAVTLDLLPLVLAVARQGRIEEEMFLTTFLFEEAKHMDFFSRWLREVTDSAELPPASEPSVQLFDVELPNAMNRLLQDQSAEAMARASVTYNIIVEGVLAETGYNNYHRSLAVNGLMPGLCTGLVNIKRDESRHIAYGVYLLSRLVAEESSVWGAIEQRMAELQPLVVAIMETGYENNPDGITPFGLPVGEFNEFAANQFRKRYERISKARDRSIAEIEASSDPADVEGLVTEV